MNIRSPASAVSPRKAAGFILLMLAMASIQAPALAHGMATQVGAYAGTSPTPTSERLDAPPSSRINGRADWDIDYPSQLAPDARLTASSRTTAVRRASEQLNAPG